MLGPLEVGDDDAVVEIRRGIPRLILLALILRVGEAVHPQVLADLVWGDDQPANPANALQTQVSYLRRTIGGDVIVTRPGGYVLDVAPEHVDAVRFQRIIERAGRLGDAATTSALEAAVRELDEALAMWRGDAFGELGGHHFAIGDATRLEEARLAALEARIECLLALGRHRDAVADLTGLVSAYPLRERLHELLMLAQYRSGRQAEALRSYDVARELLLDELGLDPGPSLQRMQALVLEQAAELDWQPPADDVGFPQATPVGTVAAPGAAARRRRNVPAALGALIGRAAEVERVSELLGQRRLVTLTGPAGAGKTSLAVEIARGAPPERNVWFVDLDGVRDDGLVALTVASALGAPTSPDADAVETIAAAVGDDDGLLVLDTCEHVVAGAATTVSGLLAGCPALHVLATSRRPLSIRGELAWPVPPLQLPLPDAPVEDLPNVPAVSLFLERAGAVRPDFGLTEQNAGEIVEICAALDGLPLAIELAAAQADTLSPAAIRARLADRFALLVDGGRDASARQQTLRSAIDWSFDLLTDAERRLFLDLSVFAGPFGLDEVAAVASPDLPDPVVLLGSLVRQSMVAVVGEDRYQLLDTPREYGRDVMAEADRAAAHERHLRHFVDLAATEADGIWSGRQQEHIAHLRAALPNLRAAIDWGFANGHDELAARIVGSLGWFFMLEGMFTEALAFLDRADEAAPRLSRFARAAIAYGRGLIAAPLGRLEVARTSCERCVALAREGGDVLATAAGLAALSVTEWALGELDAAARHQDEAITLYDEAGDPWRRADILVLRARTAIDQGDPQAKELLAGVIPLARSVGDLHAGGMAMAQLSLVAYAEGDHETAAARAADSLAAHEALHEPEGTAGALHLLGRAQLALGDVDHARSLHARALQLALAIGHVGALCEAVEDFAAVAHARGDHRLACELLDVAERERAERGVSLRPFERQHAAALRAAVAAALGDAAAQPSPALDFETALDRIRSELV